MTGHVSLRARASQRYAYSGRSLFISNLDGAITGQGTEGFYVDNTRLLCREVLTADGKALKPVAASPVRGDSFLAYAELPQSDTIPEHAVYITIARFLGDGMRVELTHTNYAIDRAARFMLEIHLAADFADCDEAETGQLQQTADVKMTWDERRKELVFRYQHPHLDRAVAIRIERAPGEVHCADSTLSIPLELAPRQSVDIHLVVEPIFDGKRRTVARRGFDESVSPVECVRERLREGIPDLVTTNPTVARAWQTATADLATLPLGLPEGPAAPMAGLPLYQQFFGRDTLTTAWQALLAMPEMLRDTLQANAAYQGTRIDDWLDEEPGKLIHQMRWGPLSLLGVNPFARYYGDWATPPDFLIMLGQYLAWTNDLATVRELLPAARKAIDWIDRYGDLDRDGFLEYESRSSKGVKNQGWKDSDDGICNEQGQKIENPVATSEIQAYWYAGLEQAAVAFLAAGDLLYAADLVRKARALKKRFDQAFWMEDVGFYALALGPDKRQVRSIASNAGHLLAAGIVPVAKAGRVVRRLMQPDLFSGWGIRTLSSTHAAYNPFSYHRGSVWPVENGTFALGFARYGYWDELHRLAEGLFAATDLFEMSRLPEAIGGLPRDAAHPHPGLYPQSCAPQAWSASAVVILVQSLLGLRPVAPLGVLLVDPHLPPWLPDLRLEGIRVGGARVDLEFRRRSDGRTTYRVLRREGCVRVLHQPVPDSPEASIAGRARAAVTSIIRL